MEIDQNFIAIPTLIALVIAVIAIIVPLINSYRNVVKDAMKNIQEIEKNLVSRVDVLENKMRELSTNLEYVSYRTLYTELTVQSTQAWNESKLITHIKKGF